LKPGFTADRAEKEEREGFAPDFFEIDRNLQLVAQIAWLGKIAFGVDRWLTRAAANHPSKIDAEADGKPVFGGRLDEFKKARKINRARWVGMRKPDRRLVGESGHGLGSALNAAGSAGGANRHTQTIGPVFF